MKTNTKVNALHILAGMKFSCPRLCTPGVECLFGPVFRAIGSTRVVSHTVKVDVQFRDREILKGAVTAMEGTMLGMGTHRLFAGQTADGFGFRLPRWTYPLVLGADNKLAFDDYHGSWGNVADIKTLEGKYAIEAGRIAATNEGWMTEMVNGDLMIFHPDGPTITVKADGTVDSNGFTGNGCDVASKIADAIGNTVDRTNKAEYYVNEGFVQQ